MNKKLITKPTNEQGLILMDENEIVKHGFVLVDEDELETVDEDDFESFDEDDFESFEIEDEDEDDE